ncbi:MAG: DegT/DnrJ/EryC1/StrS family aminotransferase [Negativibacillus massiliensis]|mgnify:FL=1|uniref:DegT/DnrJ/EryC1/StrS family aminotransferase n=1 Tax=Negativibacillus massiliensis TaxID=1871035 RepID=UPI0009778340|nr:DegT/DnrJ/EryC1/StrS family aminotransferase [Negativibacillus massiliensis]MCI6348107.1 DegT/DnrJ/EryC1/StrS family aminotransferase [Negativibacillus massiliensis]MDY4048665.1 DegT/DnrJ/EryC1/StrS family aminotransferase [Negativibacillus massiliensis]
MEFRDLKRQYQVLKPQMDAAMLEVAENCNFISGKQVTELEQQLAEYVGVKHCVTCGNGTDALTLVMMAWDIKAGDAVFVPTFTFFASAEVVAFEGATPVFVDVDERTFNVDPVKLEEAIEQVKKEGKLNPRAVIAVDLFGQPADYTKIEEICKKHGLLLLEDGAQGFGGKIGDRTACSFGDAAATSFFPAKPLGCYGDGGAVFTNDDEMADYMRSIRVHGKSPADKYDNLRIGLNSRLDTIQAAVLKVKLQAFKDHELESVNRAAKLYDEYLGNVVKTPVVPEGFYSSWAQYTLILDSKEQRTHLQKELKEQGIPTMVYYPKPMHLQGAFADLGYKKGDFPVAESLCERVLSLPMHPYLNEEDIRFVANAVKAALNL